MNSAEYAVMRAEEKNHWWYRGLRSMLSHSFPDFPKGFRPVILDAGCGTGANLRLLERLAPEGLLLGLDCAQEALENIDPGGKGLLCRGDVNRMPLADESVDLVFAGDLLGQKGVACPDVLDHFFRILKPGGTLLLNVPAFPWLRGEHDLAVHVTKRFLPGELKKDLVQAGFVDQILRFWNGFLLLPMFLYRRLGRPLHGDGKDWHSDLKRTGHGMNAILGWWMDRETVLATTLGMPIGSSIFATARKPLGASH